MGVVLQISVPLLYTKNRTRIQNTGTDLDLTLAGVTFLCRTPVPSITRGLSSISWKVLSILFRYIPLNSFDIKVTWLTHVLIGHINTTNLIIKPISDRHGKWRLSLLRNDILHPSRVVGLLRGYIRNEGERWSLRSLKSSIWTYSRVCGMSLWWSLDWCRGLVTITRYD